MTKSGEKYHLEYLLLAAVLMSIILGFWKIYFAEDSQPQLHHHLHLATTLIWLFLLFFQLSLIRRKRYATHRKVGLIVLVIAPLLVGTAAMLSVHSAYEATIAGEPDELVVQNVMTTIELGLLIVLAFLLRKRRKLHASFLLSTTILFLGISLFFALISFVPQFKIEGPETFYRFQSAAMTGQAICLAVGLLFFVRDVRHGWPFFLASLFFLMNEAIRSVLNNYQMIDPLTSSVASMNQTLTFFVTFALMLLLLAPTGLAYWRRSKQPT